MPPLTTSDADVDRLLREADRAAEAGSVDEASARYREIVTRHGDDRTAPLAHLGLGRIAIGTGHYEEAIATLERAEASGDPVVAERARLYRGVALHLLRRSGDAVPLLAPLVGHTTSPEETRLLLDTLTNAALATDARVTALEALDARFDASEESERPAVLERLREVAMGTLSDDEIRTAYDALRRSGRAWPFVAERALRRADEVGDLERVRAIAQALTERGVPLDAALATLVSRAERIAQADPRVIGAILPLSGPARELGQRALRGMMLAAGAPGQAPRAADAPQLVFRDDASDPARAVAAVDELVSIHRAVAILGPLDPACAEAAAARAAALGVPLISLAPSPLEGRSPLGFRLMPTLEEELGALVRAARDAGASRLAVLRPSSRWGDRVRAGLTRLADASGLTIVADERYATSATSFGEEVARVAAAEPDAILIADAAPRVALVAPALATVGLWAPGSLPPGSAPTPARRGRPAIRPHAVPILIPSVGLDPRLPALAGRYLQGALFAAPFLAPPAPSPSPAAAPSAPPGTPVTTIPRDPAGFAAAYRAQFQADPDLLAAYAFDAFTLVRGAVTAGNTGRADVARWLAASSAGAPTLGASGGFSAARTPLRATSIATLEGSSFRLR